MKLFSTSFPADLLHWIYLALLDPDPSSPIFVYFFTSSIINLHSCVYFGIGPNLENKLWFRSSNFSWFILLIWFVSFAITDTLFFGGGFCHSLTCMFWLKNIYRSYSQFGIYDTVDASGPPFYFGLHFFTIYLLFHDTSPVALICHFKQRRMNLSVCVCVCARVHACAHARISAAFCSNSVSCSWI